MTTIKLILNSPREIEAMIEYIEEAIEVIRSNKEKLTVSYERLQCSAEAELMDNLLLRLKIKQLNRNMKTTIGILQMQALLLVKYNDNISKLNLYFQNLLLNTSSNLHKQLIDNL